MLSTSMIVSCPAVAIPWLLKMSLSTKKRLCSNNYSLILQHWKSSPALFYFQQAVYVAGFQLNKVRLWGVQFFNNCAGLVTVNADRGHHFTGDLTEQLEQEQCDQMELG